MQMMEALTLKSIVRNNCLTLEMFYWVTLFILNLFYFVNFFYFSPPTFHLGMTQNMAYEYIIIFMFF